MEIKKFTWSNSIDFRRFIFAQKNFKINKNSVFTEDTFSIGHFLAYNSIYQTNYLELYEFLIISQKLVNSVSKMATFRRYRRRG